MGGTGDLEGGFRDEGRRCLHILDGGNRGAYERGFQRKFLNLPHFEKAYTGRAPFVINIQAAIFDIMAGKRPGRPAMLRHDKLWEIVERCWDQEPEKRPTTSQLLESFRVS